MSPQDETFRQERRDLLNLDRVLMQFAGRVPMLDRLRDALVTVTLPRVLALHGIGGSGKTFLLAILRVDDELCRLLSACPNAWQPSPVDDGSSGGFRKVPMSVMGV